jgi:hypothetical protein
MIALGQEGQPGHGQLLMRFGESEGQRPLSEALDAAHCPTIASPAAATIA